MNLVLEIRLLGKIILDRLPLEIPLVPKLPLPLCDVVGSKVCLKGEVIRLLDQIKI